MKKLSIMTAVLATLSGILLGQPAVAQTNSQAAMTNPANPAAAANPAPAAAVATVAPAASAPASQSNLLAVATTTPDDTSSATNAPADTNAQPANAMVPIQFQDVPITTAIESLARLAGINYLLDPKIGYGQPDQSGQIKPEPTLSLRWENVTPAQALLALLDNYGLQLVENPKTGIARITTKDPTALPQLETRVVQLKYASTSNMVIAVQSALTDKRSRVVPDDRTSQLVVVATQPEQDNVDALLARLDTPTRQVLIETHLVELTSKPSTAKGVDWSGTLQAQNISFGNGVVQPTSLSSTQIPGVPSTSPGFGGHPGVTTTPNNTSTTTVNTQPQSSLLPGGVSLNTLSGFTPGFGFLSADGAQAVLSFLNQSAEAQVVSTPRLVTLDNETATISVITTFPVVNVTASTVQTTGGSSITYSNIGTTLEVTPRITANNYILLKVTPDVSSFAGQQTITSGGQAYTADLFETRHISTEVLIPNAHTLVMGGLVQDNPNATYTKVPILGDIPVLGFAFSHQNTSLEKDNLLIFITPTIVQDEDYKQANSDFLNSQPRTMKDPMNPHSWYDGAEPGGDWSNPISADKPASSESVSQNGTATPASGGNWPFSQGNTVNPTKTAAMP